MDEPTADGRPQTVEASVKEHACFKAIKERWDEPFMRPIVVDKEAAGFLTKETWAVRVFNVTSSDRISKVGKGHLYLNYCPFCGMKLRETEEDGDED